MTRQALVEAARGDRPLDLVIRGSALLNVYTGEVYRADIGLFGNRIRTRPFNGYAEQVASLYAGMDLRKNF